ncbi:MAG: L-rhamnose mutarotase [Chloroflexi bacterium]|nr:L-rhamnose mutarotase [Chloroflexota bacterium]
MERVLFYLRIFPGTEAEYDRLHAAVPQELQDEIRASGFQNMSGFRRGTDVWYYAEAVPDRATVFATHGPKAAVAAWNRRFATIIAESADASGQPLFYEELFYTGGSAGEGDMSRSLLALVVNPDRIPYYEQLHAEPWPDLIEAIATSGYSNYSGFRRGNHVVYYGEYYPDIETVSARMGKTEVNGRWGAAFEGVITTLTTADGKLITADEIYHQD